MSSSSSPYSGRSFAAFLLLPQFKYSFTHLTHIGPVFVRTLALMFAQAGLIDPYHPATRYGLSDEVRNVRLRDLIGEAWYNLRTGEGITPYQYGMFASLVFFLVITTVGLGLFLAFYVLQIGQTAQAQLFAHPSGNATDMTTVCNYAGPGLQDMTAPFGCAGGAHNDIALHLLDRVLRQGLSGNGGPMQNALGPLLATYSSAVLVVASFITAWAVFSIVTDTARTGTLGGGRHNMVWTPIRFIFALGLMVPIGGGANSGQFMVMKLAEWGSNLGSSGWQAYTASIATASLVAAVEGENVTWLARDMGRIFTCVTAYNAYLYASTGTSFATGDPVNGDVNENWVRRIDDWSGNPYVNTRYYGNQLNKDMCGSVSIPLWDDPSIAGPNPVDIFKRTTRVGFAAAYQQMLPDAIRLGCAVAAEEVEEDGFDGDQCHGGVGVEHTTIATGTPANRGAPAAIIGTPAYIAGGGNMDINGLEGLACGGNGAQDEDMPDQSCLNAMMNSYAQLILGPDLVMDPGSPPDGILEGARAGLVAGFAGTTGWNNMMAQGWAGMGSFFSEISRINREMLQSSRPEISTNTKGALQSGDHDDCGFWDSVGGFLGIGGDECTKEEHTAQVMASLSRYDTWWDSNGALEGVVLAGNDGAGNTGNAVGGSGEAAVINKEESSSWSSIKKALTGGMPGLVSFLAGGDGGGYFLYTLAEYRQPGAPEVFPMAEIAHAGQTMYERAMWMYGIILTGSIIGGAIPYLGGGVVATVAGPIGELMLLLAQAMFLPGVMLMFYVPLIPWMRVTFAVIGWLVTVFEAVAMVPIAALAHLRTDGEGLMGPLAQGAYMLWLNVLLRPILTVIGYVGAMLIFNAGSQFVGDTLAQTIPSAQPGGGTGAFDQIFNTVIYMGLIYTLANSIFKMVDIIPDAAMKWIGSPAQAGNPIGQGDGNMGLAAGVAIGTQMGVASRGLGKGMGSAGGKGVKKGWSKLRGKTASS